MKTKIFILLALVLILSSCKVYSQNGWGRGSNYNNIYDVYTVETISGQVTSIDKIYPDKNISYGIHMTLNTSDGDISVHLGPGWFIENQDILLGTGDNVTVTGSKVTYEGSKVIMAKEVTKGDQILKLRDDNGYPIWSGWRNNKVYSQNGWGRGSNYNNIYDVYTVETISGQVTSIDKIYPDKNMSYGIHMTLNTSDGDISVHLGPGWFIENQDILIVAGDNVTVTGSKVTYEGSKVIIAKEVTKGDQVLKLRDDNGYPLWSGWRNK